MQMTINELMKVTHVRFQITRLTKTLLAHIALVRYLVSVKTHVELKKTI
jgi:hypothetical protein